MLGLVYLAFFCWYTSFRGPLTPEEIVHYRAVVADLSDDDPERIAAFQRFMETDTGDDFGMISFVDLKQTPTLIEGVEPGESSEAVLDKYADPFFSRVVMLAAHPSLVGRAAAPAIDSWGIEGASDWNDGIVVRWRSRRDFMQFVELMRDESNENDIHAFKVAAMEKTIAYPLDPWFHLGDPRLLLALVFAVIGLSVSPASLRRG